MTLTSTMSAVGPNITSSFLASGGTAPYAYSVLPGGAGGTIDPSTGLYTAPVAANSNPSMAYDTIQAVDNVAVTATSQILVGNALLLFWDILKTELSLADDHIYLWDQKLMQPTDSTLYIAIGVVNSRPFGNTNGPDGSGGGLTSIQSVNMLDEISIDIISRGPEARDRKAEVIMALNSNYAQQQQTANSFNIGQLPAGAQFINLSEVDGAAIPYRFRISVNLQYFVVKSKQVPYFDNYDPVQVTTEP